MKIRIPSDRRASWRDRFLEIARQADGVSAPQAIVAAAGLRLRLRTSAFAAMRRRPA